MKPFEKFMNYSLGLRELLDIYLELRQHFQELEFSEKDLLTLGEDLLNGWHSYKT